ncbi:MAG: hypothetical protein OEW06_15050, partial [Gemmatimonadota bacterium]|nr:hypothetical protein [Gemmatimonadota bacterium]
RDLVGSGRIKSRGRAWWWVVDAARFGPPQGDLSVRPKRARKELLAQVFLHDRLPASWRPTR